MFSRYALRPGARNVCLLSEGTFHQVHGGIATSGRSSWDDFGAEHRRIFGVDWERPIYESLFSGRVRVESQRFLADAVAAVPTERLI
jgi:hypothetical protein